MSFRRMEENVRASLGGRRVVLAVSGGVDSMALLHLAAAVAPASVAAVACFDHRTGRHARSAVSLVAARASALGMSFVSARAPERYFSEADWRRERWAFLRQVARAATENESPLAVATAHTQDDQVETVLMRILRSSGARGLAGLLAGGDLLRPLLDHTREELERYVAQHDIPFLEDPSNTSRRFLRNRIRLDIIPALERVDPQLRVFLLDIAARAAQWRRDVEEVTHLAPLRRIGPARSEFSFGALAELEAPHMAVVVPALVARAGIRLDRRGTALLAAFLTDRRRTRGRVQLSGGHEVEHRGDRFVVAPLTPPISPPPLTLTGDATWGAWHFRVTSSREHRRLAASHPLWTASLPRGANITVRAWRPGDRLLSRHATKDAPAARRRVKRFLSDAGISGADRRGWPVVLVDDTVAWIPGVKHGPHGKRGRGSDKSRGHITIVCERALE